MQACDRVIKAIRKYECANAGEYPARVYVSKPAYEAMSQDLEALSPHHERLGLKFIKINGVLVEWQEHFQREQIYCVRHEA